MPDPAVHAAKSRSLYPADAFARLDEGDDADFCAIDRLEPHLDARARRTVERIVGTLIVEPAPVILDLMASFDSHLPATLQPARVVGLGLNRRELDANPALTERVIHDLNREPTLPFPDATFDAVLNTVSVDYLTRPFDVFAEIGRVLKPGGLCLVTFSNRFFEPKVIKLWRDFSEMERQLLVEDYFNATTALGPHRIYVSRGQPRPADDRYAGLGLPSDPITALYAEKVGVPTGRPARPRIDPEPDPCPPRAVVEVRKRAVKQTMECPYCRSKLQRWDISQTPFTEWDMEYVMVCWNNDCPYLISGWDEMSRQGNHGFTYRLVYNPLRDRCMPAPVPSLQALRETKVTPRG